MRIHNLCQRAFVTLLNRAPAPLAARIGTSTLAARLLRPLVNRLVPRTHVVAEVRAGPSRGIRLLVEPRGEKFYWTGWHERPVQEALARILRPGDVFWDVGAHIGLYSILGSRAIGEEGRVHAFEPMPANRARLEESLRLSGCANVTVHPHALAADSGEARLHAAGLTTMWSLVPSDGPEHIAVECRRLDDVVTAIDPPDVLKIDAEGVELDILRGGAELLARRQPTLILELHQPEDLEQARAILAGNEFQRLDRTHWLIAPGARSVDGAFSSVQPR